MYLKLHSSYAMQIIVRDECVEQKTVWFSIYCVTDLNWQWISGGADLGYYEIAVKNDSIPL